MSGACTGKVAVVRVKSFRHSHQEDTNQAATTTKLKRNKENNHNLFQVSTPSPYICSFMQILVNNSANIFCEKFISQNSPVSGSSLKHSFLIWCSVSLQKITKKEIL